MHQTIRQLSDAVTTLSDGRTDLFGAVRNLQVFVSAIAQSDEQVGQFNGELAAVSGVLADNREQLTRMLTTLDSTLPMVRRFVADNRDRLSSAIDGLGRITTTLSNNRQALADSLQLAPTAVSDLHNAYDPLAASLNGSLAVGNLRDPAEFICSAIYSAGGAPDQCRSAIGPLAQLAKMGNVPITVSPVERNGRENQTMPDGSPVPGASPSHGQMGDLGNLLLPGGSR
jgi:phospholipid/cholesterol/gamma-HCH transport system substrate-binding protein